MKNIRPILLWCFMFMVPLNACSGSLSIEKVPYDPNIIGKVVHFTVPVVYMELTEIDSEEYPKKEIETGRVLIQETKVKSLYDPKGTHIINKINETMAFTITELYWIRQDWFTREFAPDVQRLLLKDENGIHSVALRSILFDSDKRELGK